MKRSRCSILLLSIFYAVCLAQPGRKQVAEGNKLYLQEKYDAASNKYQDALLEDPKSPLIHFNAGDALYKKKDYEKTIESYNKALGSDQPLMQSQTYYNIGNTLYRQGKLPESILAYEQALKLNPDDLDAKYNLEFVRNKLKENTKPQQQQQQQKQQQQQQNQNDQQQDRKQQEKEQKQAESQQQDQREMTKEQAQRLLDAIKEDQKKMKEEQVRAEGRLQVEKDW